MSLNKVYIIESESASDLLAQRSEGEGLQRLLGLCGKQSTLRRVCSVDAFRNELAIFARSGSSILHLSCHGNEDCIAFTNGETLSWNDLHPLLEPVMATNILCLSSCSPLGTTKLVNLFDTDDRKPFAIAGSDSALLWRHAFLAWTLVYNALTGTTENSGQRMRNALAAFTLMTDQNFYVHFWVEKEGEEGHVRHNFTATEELDLLRNSGSELAGAEAPKHP